MRFMGQLGRSNEATAAYADLIHWFGIATHEVPRPSQTHFSCGTALQVEIKYVRVAPAIATNTAMDHLIRLHQRTSPKVPDSERQSGQRDKGCRDPNWGPAGSIRRPRSKSAARSYFLLNFREVRPGLPAQRSTSKGSSVPRKAWGPERSRSRRGRRVSHRLERHSNFSFRINAESSKSVREPQPARLCFCDSRLLISRPSLAGRAATQNARLAPSHQR